MVGSNNNAAEEAAFLSARRSTSRSAFKEYRESLNISTKDEAGVTAALQQFRQLPLLLDPSLQAFSLRVMYEARGRVITLAEPFPSTLWLGGAEDTWEGRPFLGNIGNFAQLLIERATKLAAKRAGWVVEPTTNPEGRRTNEYTLAMHALFLDCDDTGDWHKLITTLSGLQYAHIAYQSGGWTPDKPKWRVVIPLSSPFDTRTEAKRDQWKTLYNHCRVVLGSVAQLTSVGFDPATDTPCCPWFLTERRNETDPPRQVIWSAGHTLDLTALALALPEWIEPTQTRNDDEPVAPRQITLSEERFEEIVDALTSATVRVPSGRRDIYMALPGVLLDRGITPDDVLQIIEEVSERYPRSHPELHADNIHCAHTTISKWEAGGRVTRIGTLQALAPDVAEAVDEVLPDPLLKALVDATRAICEPVVLPVISDSNPVVAALKKRRRHKMSDLGRALAPIAARMKINKNTDRQIDGLLLEKFVHGETLQSISSTPEQVDVLVCRAMLSVGYHLPNVTWREALDFASTSLLSMDFTQSTERVAKAEGAFYEGQGKKKRRLHKKKVEVEAQLEKSRTFLYGEKKI